MNPKSTDRLQPTPDRRSVVYSSALIFINSQKCGHSSLGSYNLKFYYLSNNLIFKFRIV